jgi:hypothetical protein
MTRHVWILTFLFFSNTQAQTQSGIAFQNAYFEQYQQGILFLQSQKSLINQLVVEHGAEKEVLVSAVFPEIVRFSDVSNLMETASLELLYTRFGNAYADFSIGRFQMKPSFIEKMESYVKEFDFKAFTEVITFKSSDEKEIRKERIERLKTITWQLKYLNCFYFIVEHKFKKTWQNIPEKIRFFAAAYNCGFENSAQDIEKWFTIKAFPYGLAYKGQQYNYTDISVDFYQRFYHPIFR